MRSSSAVERLARFQLFQHVIHLREGKVGIFGLPRLAVGVEFFGDGANADP